MHVGRLNGDRGGPFGACCGGLDGLLLLALLLLLSLWLLLLECLHLHVHRHRIRVGDGDSGRRVHPPLIGFTLEEFVDGELESGAGDGKAGRGRVVGLDGESSVAKGHAGGSGGGWA